MCENGGVCSLVGYNYKCSCVGNYIGKNCQNKILDSSIFKNSTILTNEQGLNLVKLIGLNESRFSLLYQSSRDGFDNNIFHSKCDGVSGTLVMIKANNSNIFGGFTLADWSGNYEYKSDPTAFMFSLVNEYNFPVKMDVVQSDYAILTYPSDRIAFGNGLDLFCFKYQCQSNLGRSYQLPNFLTYGTTEAQSFLGGSYKFQTVEIEVFFVEF